MRMNLRPKTFIVRKEAPAARCEVCHLADCFDPATGTCERCRGILLPELPSTRVPYLADTPPPMMLRVIRKISGMMLYCLYGLGASLCILTVAATLDHFHFSQAVQVALTLGTTLLILVFCILVLLIILYFTCMVGYVTYDMGRELYVWIRSLLRTNPPR